jgi:hypothetical protein
VFLIQHTWPLTFMKRRSGLALGAGGILPNDFAVIVYATSSTADRSFTEPTGWSERAEDFTPAGSTRCNMAVWYKVLDGSETLVQMPPSGNTQDGPAAVVMVLRGVDTGTPFDVADATIATGTGTARPNPNAITPTTSGAWPLIAGCGSLTLTPFTSSDLSATANHFPNASGDDTNDVEVALGIKTNWSSGAFDPAQWGGGGTSPAASWLARSMALRPASGQSISFVGSLSVSTTNAGLTTGTIDFNFVNLLA